MLKKIVLHTAATDNVGGYHDAGSELEVGADLAAGTIAAERARELIAANRAVSATAEEAANDDGLSKMKPEALKELATREGVTFGEKPTKVTLIELIRADRIAKAAAAETLPPGAGTGEGGDA